MATFVQLQNRVLVYLIDAPEAVRNDVPTIINKAIRDLQKEVNWKIMERETLVVTTAGDRLIKTFQPSDLFKQPREKPYGIDPRGSVLRMDWLPTREDVVRQYPAPQVQPTDQSDRGQPRHVTYQATDNTGTDVQGIKLFEAFPVPNDLSEWDDGNWRIVLPYYAFLPDLSADADTNWFTANGDEFIFCQALGMGFMADWAEDRAAGWFQLAAGHKRLLKKLGAAETLGKSDTLVPRSDIFGARDQWRRS